MTMAAITNLPISPVALHLHSVPANASKYDSIRKVWKEKDILRIDIRIEKYKTTESVDIDSTEALEILLGLNLISEEQFWNEEFVTSYAPNAKAIEAVIAFVEADWDCYLSDSAQSWLKHS